MRAKFEVAPALLREVRTARQNSFDRVVFEFEGKEIPNYRIRYPDKPDPECGSGEAVQMTGGGLLQMTFESTNAHTEAGQPTITDRERRLNLPTLKELRFTCDFEGQVVVVLGFDSRHAYRVLELYNPTRVVVDINHSDEPKSVYLPRIRPANSPGNKNLARVSKFFSQSNTRLHRNGHR